MTIGTRLRRWFASTHSWRTGQHVAVAATVILAAMLASAALFADPGVDADDDAPTAAASGELTSTTSAPTTSAPPPPESTATPDSTAPSIPPSPSTSSGSTERADQLDARDVLATVPIELEHRGGYDRDLFAVWIDADGDGCTTREEVLADEHLDPELDTAGCVPVPGRWVSTYDGMEVTDPSALDVDHVVSLKEAWDSGAWTWTPDRRIAYGNDLTDGRTLIAVTSASNRGKGDRDPSNWIPDRDDAVCGFVGDWIAVKARWSMTMDPSEHGRLRNLLDDRCAGLTIAPWAPAP